MEGPFVRERCRANLLRGMSYHYWLWLSPTSAARLNNAVTAFERA